MLVSEVVRHTTRYACRRRSPINAIDKFDCPIIFFQGAEDEVVPLNQAESMHKAVKDKGVLTALVVFEVCWDTRSNMRTHMQ